MQKSSTSQSGSSHNISSTSREELWNAEPKSVTRRISIPYRIRTALQMRSSLAGELEKGALFVLLLSTFGNGLNYLFQILMGRMLSVEDFGTLNALLSIFMMAAVPLGAVTALVAKFVVEFKVTDQQDLLGIFVYRILRVSLFGSLIVCLMGFSLSHLVARYLNISVVQLVQLVWVLIALNILYTATIGVVQGLKRFIALGALLSLVPAIKLAFSVVLVWLGYQVFGALAAIGLAILCTIVVITFYIKQNCVIRNEKTKKLNLSKYLRFFFSAFLLSSFMALITNMDVVLIKHYLPETEAGLYSPAMVFGRILLYAPAALVQVMYPLTVEANTLSPRSTFRLVLRVMLLSSVIIILCIIPLALFGDFALSLVFGAKYIDAAHYILPASMFIIPVSYLTVLINFAMAVDRTRFLTISLIIGCVSSIVIVHLFHAGVVQILSTLTVISLIIVFVNIVYLVARYQSRYRGEGHLA